MKENAEGIDAHHVVERFAVIGRLIEGRGQACQHADERYDTQGFLRVLRGNDRIHQHYQDAEDGEHHFWEDPDIVNGRNHRPITCIRAWVTWAAEGAAACTPLENCLSAKETDGSIECSHRLGATPMTSAATTSGHIATRSRASMSCSVLFAGWVMLP